MSEYQLSTTQLETISDFVLSDNVEIPQSSLDIAALLLLDTIGVTAGAATLEVAQIGREFAVDFYNTINPLHQATLMFDGRKASIPGAAFAGATQTDNLDAHDGFNPVKGHIGCAVIPALFAFAEHNPDLSGRDALKLLVMSYEIAARAGLALHNSVSDYHTSGAWNALGVAALGCKMIGATAEQLREAMGIAEYHGPRSQMMREIDFPSMLHDGSAMGAFVGCSAAILAKRGFQGAPAITIEEDKVSEYWQDLGSDWTIERNYIKPYPICRWAHAAIDGARLIKLNNDFDPKDIVSVEVRTFTEASKLFPDMPSTTSEAQYSLPFAVATMLNYGKVGPDQISGDALKDKAVADLLPCFNVVEDEKHCARFPAGRWSDISITLSDGRKLESGDVPARGGIEDPLSEDEVEEKFHLMVAGKLSTSRASLLWEQKNQLKENGSKFKQLSDLVFQQLDA